MKPAKTAAKNVAMAIFIPAYVISVKRRAFPQKAIMGTYRKAALEGLPTAAKPKAAMAAKKPFSKIRRKSIVA